MGVPDNGTILVQVDFEVFGHVQGESQTNFLLQFLQRPTQSTNRFPLNLQTFWATQKNQFEIMKNPS